MCGFVFRVVLMATILFVIIETNILVEVVTLGGQILGCILAGIVLALTQTLSSRITTNWLVRVLILIIATFGILYSIFNFLPGYLKYGQSSWGFFLLIASSITITVDYFIKDR
ncbi:MAG TPA: hypothetical protein IAB06_04525 [Candidatus Avacidaminococcus intestinavium]|uniref:Uncharacterized protein n=1 Tax=Candidatus Avacidaminococcus intestinavium TaxID=2840684 RepID=A0A9D1MPK5_9FIRM|nr:hypothetical protein [Candidatus Avacidaminococcus intestinavium]